MYYTTQIPLLIDKALNGDYSDIQQSVSFSLAPNYFADGLGITVPLSEADEYSIADIEIDSKYRIFADDITGEGLGGEYLLVADEVWNISKLEKKRIQYSQRLDVPVLVLNGKYNPVIPPKYDKIMKKNLKNCYIFRFDGVPHSAFDNATDCALPMILEFLNDPGKAPDSSCVKNLKQEFKLPISD
jgi:pimeloyl-ACP methyl ester carboxylesterase